MTRLSVYVNGDVFHLSKMPGMKSLAVFVGIVSLGFGAAYYGSATFLMNFAYIFGCFLIAASCLEDWEDCILDRGCKKVSLMRSSLFQKCLKLRKTRYTEISLDNVMAIRVESRKGQKNNFDIQLLLTSGTPVSIVEGNLWHDWSQCELIAERIRKFLKLGHMEPVDELDLDDNSHYSDNGSSSSDSEVVLANAGRPRETIWLINERR